MNGKIIALATGIVAAATLAAPTAEAGMRIHFGFPIGVFNAGGGHGYHHSYRRDEEEYRALRRAKAAEAARRRERAAAIAAAAEARKEREAARAAAKAAEKRKAAAAAALAAAEAKKKADAVAAESTDAVEKADTRPSPARLKTAANETADDAMPSSSTASDQTPAKLECKRYFANVGMTISVPCPE